jgi:hypothetical protein
MEVIRHQAVGQDRPPVVAPRRGHLREEGHEVRPVPEDVIAIIAPVHHVMNSGGDSASNRSSHVDEESAFGSPPEEGGATVVTRCGTSLPAVRLPVARRGA